jgi:UDP-N-acetyl-2-amino-2-deoxyglucuronate dehydrogenase
LAKLRVGIVGLEHYHATGWVESVEQLADRLEIVALYDPDPKFGQSLTPAHSDPHLSPSLKPSYRSVPLETDLDSLIRNHRLDVAVVTLPPVSAPAAIERLAKAGIHLLVDKPGARTAAEAERAFAAARSAGVKVAVGLTRRLGRGWQDARAMVASGRLGRLFSTEAIFVTSSVRVRDPANQIFSREKSGGGILHWLGIHDLDLLLWLTGDRIVEVQAMAGTVGGEAIDVEDTISLALRYASGAIGTVHYAYALPRTGGDGYVALRGSGGSVKVLPNGNVEWIGPGSASDPVMVQETTYTTRSFPGYGSAGVTILHDLLASIEEDRDPRATGEHMTGALRVIDAAYEAARTGTRVKVAP